MRSTIDGINGRMFFLIKKNIQLPYIIEQGFQTSFNNQTEIDFPIYQGEKELAKDNYFLNSFTIKGLRKAPAGDVQFNVKMELDENGILIVSAKEVGGEHYGEIKIEGVNDLTKKQIEFFKKQQSDSNL